MDLDYTYTRYNRGASSGGVASEKQTALRLNASF